MKINLIILCVFFVIITILYILYFCNKKKNEKLTEEVEILKGEIEEQEKIIKYFYEKQSIQKDKNKKEKEIAGAKTDEEINQIVATIIARNNDRVQKQ